MRNVVTGLMMLAGAAVREKGHGFDDFGWRREVQQAREAQEADAATSGSVSGDGSGANVRWTAADTRGTTEVVAGPPIGTAGPSRGALMSVTATEDDEAASGAWDVACEREAGDRLVFDRDSVREMGGGTLFRWAPTGGIAPSADDTIYTAVADCHREEHRGELAGQAQRDARRYLRTSSGRRSLRLAWRRQGAQAGPGSARAPARRRRRPERQRDAVGSGETL